MIFGHDDDGAVKVLVGRKTVLNAFTTESGIQIPQKPLTEVKGAGQFALPGGRARPEADAATSAADEALAETGINVRSASFAVSSTSSDGTAKKGDQRSHTFFRYRGNIDQLAARANAVIRAGRTADNEVESVHALDPQTARTYMQESFNQAKQTAKEVGLDKEASKRFTDYGQDWHFGAMDAVVQNVKPRTEPAVPRPRSNSVLALPPAASASATVHESPSASSPPSHSVSNSVSRLAPPPDQKK